MAIWQRAKLRKHNIFFWTTERPFDTIEREQATDTRAQDPISGMFLTEGTYILSNILAPTHCTSPYLAILSSTLELLPEFWNEEEQGPIPTRTLDDELIRLGQEMNREIEMEVRGQVVSKKP